MDDLSIRTARLADLPELAEIFRLASLSNDGDRQHLLDNPQHLELSDESIRTGRLRLAEIAARPVGFATVAGDGPVVELEDLFVHPDWMRRGVATRLIADAVEQSRFRSATKIEVTANPMPTRSTSRLGSGRRRRSTRRSVRACAWSCRSRPLTDQSGSALRDAYEPDPGDQPLISPATA